MLRDYALIADGERGAIVGPSGEIAWLCFPGWDDQPVFGSLLGGHGRYVVCPTSPFVWGGQYDTDTLVWRDRWLTGGSVIECVEALAFPGRRDRAVLLRRISAKAGSCGVDVELDLAGWRFRSTGDGVWEGSSRGVAARWVVPADPRWERDVGMLRLHLQEGDVVDLVLELGVGGLDSPPPDPDSVLAATAAAWRRGLPALDACVAPRDARHAVAVLRGLTTSRGAMVAAATTSLPERANAGRDYDYRYAWIRDQCYAGLAAGKAGASDLLDDAVRFVKERLLSDGPDLRPAYRTDGSPVPAQSTLDLPGYPGAPSVVVGNHAGRQFQLDVFGEALTLLASAAAADRLNGEGWEAAELAAAAIEARWTEPDSGIWELEPRQWAHSRLTAAAGLRHASAAAIPGPRPNRWLSLADAIVSEVGAGCAHRSGRWQRAPDDDRVDAALLLAGLRGAVPADDPRTLATLYAVADELVVDGYTFRFRADDRPLGQAEGAFLLCGLWLALAFHQAGDPVAATRHFERNRAACGPSGVYTEEYDVHQRQLRGNFPQAFVHAVLLEAAVTLAEIPPVSPAGATGPRRGSAGASPPPARYRP